MREFALSMLFVALVFLMPVLLAASVWLVLVAFGALAGPLAAKLAETPQQEAHLPHTCDFHPHSVPAKRFQVIDYFPRN